MFHIDWYNKTLFLCLIKGKGKVFLLQARLWPREWVEVQLYSCKTAALEGVEWSAAHPGHTGKTRYPLYRKLGGQQGQSGQQKISPHWDSIPGLSNP